MDPFKTQRDYKSTRPSLQIFSSGFSPPPANSRSPHSAGYGSVSRPLHNSNLSPLRSAPLVNRQNETQALHDAGSRESIRSKQVGSTEAGESTSSRNGSWGFMYRNGSLPRGVGNGGRGEGEEGGGEVDRSFGETIRCVGEERTSLMSGVSPFGNITRRGTEYRAQDNQRMNGRSSGGWHWDDEVGEYNRTARSFAAGIDRGLLYSQCLGVIGVLGLFVFLTVWRRTEATGEFWTWLWTYPTPLLILIFFTCATTMLLHDAQRLTVIPLLCLQSMILVLTTSVGVVLCIECFGYGERMVKGVLMGSLAALWGMMFLGFVRVVGLWWFSCVRERGRRSCPDCRV